MKKGSTLFLKLAIFLIGLPILALCIFLLPQIGMEAIEQAQNGSNLAYVLFGILLVMYGSAIPYYLALYQAYRLLTYIDQDKAFSELSIRALMKIKHYAKTISALYVLALPLIFIMAQWDDAPGLVLMGLVIVSASLVIAVFAAVLQRLLQEAINIKSENDFTV